MDDRKQLTLVYKFDENWIGGTYYVLNIIKALSLFSDLRQPHIFLIYNKKSSIEDIRNIKYPYITYKDIDFTLPLVYRIINRIAKIFWHKELLKKKIPFKSIDNLYPCPVSIYTKNIKNRFYWIPDFQERYLTALFTKDEIKSRALEQQKIIRSKQPIIFSSNNARNDFKIFYPDAENKTFVIPFASMIGNNYIKMPQDFTSQKYNLPPKYFASPNQFWQHKNHMIVLKAIKLLKSNGVDVKVVFTGKEYDHRNPNYFNTLKEFVKAEKLEQNVYFLGFIDRDEQLLILKNSLCVLQPSLFEGWSTVVEDSKALNKYILLSDISLHREQIQENVTFFDPFSDVDLAKKMEMLINNIPKVENINYEDRIKEFASNIINLLN